MKIYDLIIVGSGPAGTAAAKVVSSKGMSVLIIERGKDLNRRRDLTCGWFGHGLYAMNRLELEDPVLRNPKAIKDAFRIVQNVSLERPTIFKAKGSRKGKYCRLPDSFGRELATYFFNSISRDGTIVFNTDVEKITKDGDIFYTKTNRGTYAGARCLIATGKNSLEWLEGVCEQFNIKPVKHPIKIGVRVEVPTFRMRKIIADAGDIKVGCGEANTDDARLNAFVGEWEDSNLLSAFGHCMPGKKSERTNFMVGSESDDEAIRDVKIANVLANDKIRPERVSEYMEGRSVLEHISAFRMLKEAFQSLEKLFPAFSSYAIMYAPEIRLRGILSVDSCMRTEVPGLYGAGECTSKVSSIIGALASGLLVGRTILKE
jgi:uncharacterized FAD-dependent dehydrogenase